MSPDDGGGGGSSDGSSSRSSSHPGLQNVNDLDFASLPVNVYVAYPICVLQSLGMSLLYVFLVHTAYGLLFLPDIVLNVFLQKELTLMR